MKIESLFDPDDLSRAITDGHVRAQIHSALPLLIYNYTEKAAYDGVWNEVTLQCRGLILTDDGEVVARPFRKFFNYGQPGAPEIDLNARAAVWDKMDGSLGIVYPDNDSWAVATRGSFTSDQAIKATQILRDLYGDWSPRPGETVLLEIVYPENRIVVNYGGVEDLFLLEQLVTETGLPSREFDDGHDWPGPSTKVFRHASLADALAAEPRPNAEGFVLYFPEHDERLKIKQADYVALHRIVTGLNARTVWEHLCAGLPIDDLMAPLPDEFHEWVRGIALGLETTVAIRRARIVEEFAGIVAAMPLGFTRKDFAMIAKDREDAWGLFLLLDGKDLTPELWKQARPEAFVTPVGHAFSEDTA